MMSRSRNRELPFYEAGRGRTTSAQIVSEARASIKTLSTSRPFTPANKDRTLMGKIPLNRPPSVYSLGRRHFSDEQSRPGSSSAGSNAMTSIGRLAPLENRPSVPEFEETTVDGPIVPMPPTNKRPPSVRRYASGGKIRTGINEIVEESAMSGVRSSSASAAGKSTQRVGSIEEFVMPHPPVETVSPKAQRREKHQSVKKRENGKIDGKVHHQQRDQKIIQADHPVDIVYEEYVRPLLEGLNVATESKDLCWSISQIYTVLEERNLLGRQSGKRRGTILKAIFKLLDNDDPRLLLRLAKLILALQVSGTNLISTCKLLFKLSKTESHDLLFLEEKLCASMVTVVQMSDPITYCEALVYCVGTMKLLSGNTQLQKELGEQKCISALSQLIAIINTVSKDPTKMLSEYTRSLLVQVTATLRNLAEISNHRNDFLSGAVIENLSPLMDSFGDDVDIMMNVSRILSKLTHHSSCKAVLCEQTTSLKSLLRLLSQHLPNEDIVVRLCFVLGNLTSRDDIARATIYFTCDGMNSLMHVFSAYIELDEQVLVIDVCVFVCVYVRDCCVYV